VLPPEPLPLPAPELPLPPPPPELLLELPPLLLEELDDDELLLDDLDDLCSYSKSGIGRYIGVFEVDDDDELLLEDLELSGLLLVVVAVVVVVVVVEESFLNTIVIVTNADGGTVALQVPLADPLGVPPPLPLQEMSLPRLLLIPQPAYLQPSLSLQEALQEPDTRLVTPFRSSLCLKAAHPPPPEALHELRHALLVSQEQQGST
jgi:hypothetical protein